MQWIIITLFPEVFDALQMGTIGRAQKKGLLNITCINPRDHTTDKYRTVDDTPYGGGAGMLMKAEPLASAIRAAKKVLPSAKVVYLSPQGKVFTQDCAKTAAKTEAWILLCGRYEGIDQRIIDHYIDAEWSLGDFVLSGGEFAALAMIDATARMIPGVVGDQDSVTEDTFYHKTLKYPQYTRPEVFEGNAVPEVLLSGHHENIVQWRLKHSLGATWQKRPDLLNASELDKKAQRLLNAYKREHE